MVHCDQAKILPIPIDPPIPPIERSPQPCGPNEYFNSCGGCEATCDNPGPVMCPLICRHPGQCRCSNGYVRSPDGDCVKAEECPANSTDIPNTSTPNPECGENEYLNDCGGCDGSCQEPSIACPAICGRPKCRCLPGYVRFGYAGKCMPQSQCPPRKDLGVWLCVKYWMQK
ncbi:hypothetical protein AAVH_12179 [Aphelenchoides avenae]|nr:hypothetical protein AAVH_12179 [Aphelenchus avenae]